MGSNGPGNPIIFEVIGLIVLCLVLVVVGLLIRSRGGLASRGAALAWAILCILPLFGVAFVTLVTHTVEKAEGKLPSGVNQYPAKSAP